MRVYGYGRSTGKERIRLSEEEKDENFTAGVGLWEVSVMPPLRPAVVTSSANKHRDSGVGLIIGLNSRTLSSFFLCAHNLLRWITVNRALHGRGTVVNCEGDGLYLWAGILLTVGLHTGNPAGPCWDSVNMRPLGRPYHPARLIQG